MSVWARARHQPGAALPPASDRQCRHAAWFRMRVMGAQHRLHRSQPAAAAPAQGACGTGPSPDRGRRRPTARAGTTRIRSAAGTAGPVRHWTSARTRPAGYGGPATARRAHRNGNRPGAMRRPQRTGTAGRTLRSATARTPARRQQDIEDVPGDAHDDVGRGGAAGWRAPTAALSGSRCRSAVEGADVPGPRVGPCRQSSRMPRWS